MLKIITSFKELNTRQLLNVYEESISQDAERKSKESPVGLRITEAEQDFLDYMRYFFAIDDAFLALWELDGVYMAALRVEPYLDGYLVSGLETMPDCRIRGYAKKLLQKASAHLKQLGSIKIYSHIDKQNIASLNLHLACGFTVISDHAVFLDGSVFSNHYTLCLM